MHVVTRVDSRRTETPNGVMTTLASPSQGGCGVAVWRVDFHPGRTGPVHAFDAEQVWTILAGQVEVEIGDDRVRAGAGDTLIVPPDVPRRMSTASGFTAIAMGPPGAEVYTPRGANNDDCEMAPKGDDRMTPPWIV